MARTTKTTYTCDSCGRTTASKELRRFSIHLTRTWPPTAITDLCDDCELKFIVSNTEHLTEEQANELEGMRR